jgi:hypothetical protein
MSDIILSNSQIQKIEKNDKLYAAEMRNNRDRFIRLIRKTPTIGKLILDKMEQGDVYIAQLTPEALKGLKNGNLVKMISKDTGLWTGMVKSAKGKKKITNVTQWKKKDLSPEILNSLNQLSIQAGIAELSEQMFELQKKMDLVMRLQHSDRKALVISGSQLYDQAYSYKDSQVKKMHLSNALQSMNNGRAMLMGHLQEVFSLELRERKFTDHFSEIFMRSEKRQVELYRKINSNYDLIKEDISYINLASAKIFRLHYLLDEVDAAQESVKQIREFYQLTFRGIEEKQFYFPDDMNNQCMLVHLQNDILRLSEKADIQRMVERSLAIEIQYEELVNE